MGKWLVDNMTPEGSEELAAQLAKFWGDKGYKVDFSIKEFSHRKESTIYCVRSNMINGAPPGAAKELADAKPKKKQKGKLKLKKGTWRFSELAG